MTDIHRWHPGAYAVNFVSENRFWWAWMDSNQRPRSYQDQGRAKIPTEASPWTGLAVDRTTGNTRSYHNINTSRHPAGENNEKEAVLNDQMTTAIGVAMERKNADPYGVASIVKCQYPVGGWILVLRFRGMKTAGVVAISKLILKGERDLQEF